jgi:glycosyltransferase involved in cell wall biosynthesis
LKPRGVLLASEQWKIGGKRSHVDNLQAGLAALGVKAPIVDWRSLGFAERAVCVGPARVLDRLDGGLGHRWLVPAANGFLAARMKKELAGDPLLDLIHVQEAFFYEPARRAAGGRPVVLTVHGPWSNEVASVHRLDLEHPTIRALREVERRAFLGADLVISVDQPHVEYVRRFGRTDTIPVITNFVDTRAYGPNGPAERLPEEVERWVGDRKVVLCPRRLVPKNGVHVALRAARAWRDRGTKAALVVVGEGPQRPELEALLAELGAGDVALLAGEGSRAKMPGYLRRADVVIVPSVVTGGIAEATSIAALEAQACGRPLVASAIGGLPEIVHDGEDGLLVPGDDPEALARGVERLLADPALAARLGARAAQQVEAGASHVAGARKFLDAYALALERVATAGHRA